MSDYPWLAHYPEAIDWFEPIPSRPLYTLLDDAAAFFPDHPAIDFMGKEYSYARLKDMVDRVAAGLQAIGVTRETRVGIFMPNCPQFIMTYYAILKAGGTVVNFNPLYSPREIGHQIHDAQVEIMCTLNLRILYPKLKPFIGTGSLRKVVVGFFQEALPFSKAALYTMAKARDLYLPPKNEQHITFNELLAHEPISEEATAKLLPAEQIAVLQYTGGTTGVPKGAMLSHANLYVNAIQSSRWMGEGLVPGEESILAVIPFFHVFSMTVAMNLGIANAFKIIPHPRFELKTLLSDIQTRRPTLFPGVATLYATINHYAHLERYDLSSIKKCISGGAPLPVEVKERFEALTGCALREGYGLTESSPVTHCNVMDGEDVSGSIGLPLPGTICEIIDMEDRVTALPPGEIGEICIRGPQVMKAYLNQPEESVNVLRNGRLHTGDVGYMDERGYTYVVDRMKEMIIVGGYNVYPRNIEEILYQHEAVAECAVIGLEHPKRGQMIKAFIVCQEGRSADASAMRHFLQDKISRYAIPHEFEFRSELPKSPIGKILKKELVAGEKAKE